MNVFGITIKDWKIVRKPLTFSDFLIKAAKDKKKKVFYEAAKMANEDQNDLFLKSGYSRK